MFLIPSDKYGGYLAHVGTPHAGATPHSGRYPWGSGENPHQRLKDFSTMKEKLLREGLDKKDIAAGMGFSSIRAMDSEEAFLKREVKTSQIASALKMKERGYSNVAIGKELGVAESVVRSWLKPKEDNKASKLTKATDALRAQVDKHGMVDVGSGVEVHMNVTETMRKKALINLQQEGYNLYDIREHQVGTTTKTPTKILTSPDITKQEVWKNREKIKPAFVDLNDYDPKNPMGILEPMSIDPKRVKIRYAEEGGGEEDGLVYLRPGVDDLSMGGRRFAQLRIKVGDGHYIKGVGVYRDDLPDGIDIVVNSPKKSHVPKLEVLKELSGEADNPFKTTVKQLTEIGPDGKRKVVSAVNLVNDDDSWDSWSKSLSAQFLSKQSIPLARGQLETTRRIKKDMLDEIMSMTNPIVKKHFLEQFADQVESDATDLKAAALPRQKTHAILPIPSMKDTEVHAPGYRNGERVVLIRYPHGGPFEIPELIVNNNNPDAQKIIGMDAKAVIGINAKVASKLSGADFDGDTVVLIPNNAGHIKSEPPLRGLVGFDPKEEYPYREGMKVMSKAAIQREMGGITNLISDMTLQGADNSEIERAIKHSMVVIDAHKHKLDYKLSEEVNRIKELKQKYQVSVNPTGKGGAATLVSKSSASVYIPERKLRSPKDGGHIDPKTGDLVYVETGRIDIRTGKRALVKEAAMKTVTDARELTSGTIAMDNVYAEHANGLKDLARKARLESLRVGRQTYNPDAAKEFATEVAELDAALRQAISNSPKERMAQRMANAIYMAQKEANPDITYAEAKKVKTKAIIAVRERIGAKKDRIVITESQWAAIQAGAVSETKLKKIIQHSDSDALTKIALPKEEFAISEPKKARIRAMRAANKTLSDIADVLGISVSAVAANLE